MLLRNKKILITSGPTWVAIDDVRVISNIATGQTGILLAKELVRLGARVTLLLGPVDNCCLDKKIRLLRFKFFKDLKDILKRELTSKKFDFIIHNAAVSDFAPQAIKGKITSTKAFSLNLKPLPKISGIIRRLAPKAKLTLFKLESGVSDNILIKRAKAARLEAKADFAAANRLNPYRAFIITEYEITNCLRSKKDLVNKLLLLLTNNLRT